MMKNNALINLILLIQRRYCQKLSPKLISLFYSGIIQMIYGGYLPFNTHLAGNIFLPHGLNGVFISGGASIGQNCVIYQHVTIGSTKKGSPKIGNNVVIGAGSKIIGPILIGDNRKIGAGCVIYSSIKNDSIVLPTEPMIIEKADE